MIELSQNLLIGKGKKRLCYKHPEEGNKCIKITYNRDRRTSAGVKRELRYLHKYTHKKRKLAVIPKYYGKVVTNLGEGYIFELVLDYDGTVSQNLCDYLVHNRADERLYQKIIDLYLAFRSSKALVSDLHTGNIVINRHRPEDYRLIVIEGFGNSDFIKLGDFLWSFAKMKLKRKFKRLLIKVGLPTDSIR
ncbi:MAG: YrbL family protein [Opitutales bacterium]